MLEGRSRLLGESGGYRILRRVAPGPSSPMYHAMPGLSVDVETQGSAPRPTGATIATGRLDDIRANRGKADGKGDRLGVVSGRSPCSGADRNAAASIPGSRDKVRELGTSTQRP